MSEQAERLYQDALMAIETENPTKAIDLLKQVVEVDAERVDAWTELAKLLDDKDEKRIALTTILQLEPDNEFARAELAKTEVTEKVKADEDEWVPGITRREIRVVGIALAIFTLVVCGLVFTIVSASNAQKAAVQAQIAEGIASQTAVIEQANASGTQGAVNKTETAVAAEATLLAMYTATPTITPTREFQLPTELPTETPFVPTEVSFRGELEPPPAGFGGKIYGWGGRVASGGDFRNFLVFPLADGGTPLERINNERIRFPTTDVNAASATYMQSVGGGYVLQRINLANPNSGAEILNTMYGNERITLPEYPRLTADGSKLAFVGKSPENTMAVYVIDFATRSATRITAPSDTANYTGAAISPAGTLIVAVRNDGTATDLVALDVTQPGTPGTPLTSDGNTLLEAYPSFAPDGTKVVYTVTTSDRPDQGDLYLMQLTGNVAAGTLPIMTVDGDDTFAVFDPSSQYIAFASNRVGGIYNIYVYDINSRVTYQLSADENPTFPGSWSN